MATNYQRVHPPFKPHSWMIFVWKTSIIIHCTSIVIHYNPYNPWSIPINYKSKANAKCQQSSRAYFMGVPDHVRRLLASSFLSRMSTMPFRHIGARLMRPGMGDMHRCGQLYLPSGKRLQLMGVLMG